MFYAYGQSLLFICKDKGFFLIIKENEAKRWKIQFG